MDRWMQIFKSKCNDLGIILLLCKKYIDVVLTVADNLPIGTSYTEEGLTHKEENNNEDLSNGRSEALNIMEVLKKVANSIMPILEFTAEVSEGQDSPVPCLCRPAENKQLANKHLDNITI